MAHDSISVRKPNLDFSQPIDRFYFGGNPVKTHIFNALNLLFPDGERFFVKSVHDHAKEIDDPKLKSDMRAFAGQEGQHANQHERFFDAMHAQGYRFGRFLKHFRALALWSKVLPRSLRLSITAGAEHYTASMAALLLELDMVEDCDPTMRDLITWHAIEEIEHKHVAYDVLVKMYPKNYPLRALGFILATILILGYTAFAFSFLVKQDKLAGRVSKEQLVAGRRALASGKERRFRKRLRVTLLKYFKPGFHPNQQDDGPLLERSIPLLSRTLASS